MDPICDSMAPTSISDVGHAVGSLVLRGPLPLSVEALESIAAGLARVDRAVPLTGVDDRQMPRSLRLIATEAYDVWLITWPPGSRIEDHDHADATSVIRVVSGSIVESTASGHRRLGPGVSAVVRPHTPHSLGNDGIGDCTTMHVYSPPLEELTYHLSDFARVLHPAGGSLGSRRRRVVSGRAEASTSSRRHDPRTGLALWSEDTPLRRAGY